MLVAGGRAFPDASLAFLPYESNASVAIRKKLAQTNGCLRVECTIYLQKSQALLPVLSAAGAVRRNLPEVVNPRGTVGHTAFNIAAITESTEK